MGCDIHFYAEKRGADGQWTEVWPEKEACWSCGGKGVYDSKSQNTNPEYDGQQCSTCEGTGKYQFEWYEGRNYDLFAMLADVRNGRGFAGCDTGDGFVPIDDPRDIPDDISETLYERYQYWNLDGHSHSWFTVRELRAYDWDGQRTKKRGVVSMETYRKFVEAGRPDDGPEAYSGGVSGPGVRNISNEQMDELLLQYPSDGSSGDLFSARQIDGLTYYTTVEWDTTYREAAGENWFKTVDKLEALCEGDLDSVRIVFWFDN